MAESDRRPADPDEFDFCCGKPKRCPKMRFDSDGSGALIFAPSDELVPGPVGHGIRLDDEQLRELAAQLRKRGY